MKVTVNLIIETSDRTRILKTRFFDRNISCLEELEELLQDIRDQYELAEMAQDGIREEQRKARFDPSIL